MNVLIEGCDCLGKDTQINFIEKEFEKRNQVVHIIHYSNIKLDTNEAIKKASELRYREMFNLLNSVKYPNNLVLNRSHIGESTYSPIYRSYSGDFVFDFEKDFVNKDHQPTKLIVFTDDAEKCLERDKKRNDGKSFSLELEKRKQEIKAFERAYEMSVLDKKLIHLKGRTPEEIWEQDVKPFIFED